MKAAYYETRFICPYCIKELSEDANSCCGEAGHGEKHYVAWAGPDADWEFYSPNEARLYSEPNDKTRSDE